MFNILSIFIGSLIALMTSFNGLLSTYTGNYLSSIIIHLVGLISVTCIICIKKSKLTFQKSLPLYLYSAGIIGVFTVLFNNLLSNHDFNQAMKANAINDALWILSHALDMC